MPTLLLVGVAIVAAFVAVSTLDAIRVQADIAKEALVKLERAWLVVIPKKARIYRRDHPNGPVYSISIQFARINSGRSPGWIVGGIAKLIQRSDPLPDEPDYSGALDFGPTPAPQDQEVPEQYMRGFMTASQFKDFLQGRLTVGVYGLIRYKDVIDDKAVHELRFCFLLSPPLEVPADGGYVSCLTQFGGPPAYNRSA